MTYEEAIRRAHDLKAKYLADPGSVSAAEKREVLDALRTARAAAPGARKSRAKPTPVDLSSLFAHPTGEN